MMDTNKFREHRSYFSSALKTHSQLTKRQESDTSIDVEELFTDNKQIPALISNDWQIVYGRRGTGKTTLLSFLSKDIDDVPNKASIMISMASCRVELPSNTPDDIKGLVFFEKFIIEIGHLLYRVYQNQKANKNRNRKITRLLNALSSGHALVQKSIIEIATFAHRGGTFGALETKKITVNDASGEKRGSGLKFGLNLSKLLSKDSIDAEISAKYEASKEINKNRTYIEEKFIDFQDLRRSFIDLLETLDLSQIVIIIDEWGEIDLRSKSKVQLYFAKYLRQAFFGDGRFCIKISAIKDDSVFGGVDSNGQFIGLQVGDDIFDTVNLDAIYANRMINLEEFYKELLFRRLLHCEPRLNVFSRDEEHKHYPAEGFLGFLFGDERVLPEIVNASSGIPRQFIYIFDQIAQSVSYVSGDVWKMSLVRERIANNSINHISNVIVRGSIEDKIISRIKSVVDKSKSRLLMFAHDNEKRIISALNYLYARRLLHEVNPATVSFEIRQLYRVYIVDHGCFLDWNRKYWDISKEKRPDLLDDFINFDDFIVKLDGLTDLPLSSEKFAAAGHSISPQ